MKRVAIVAKPAAGEAPLLAADLQKKYPGIEFVADGILARQLRWPVVGSEEEAMTTVDAVVVLGGDGTMIEAARWLRGRPVPILGVNLGSLGFMTDVRPEDLLEAFAALLAGQLPIDVRMKLRCRLVRHADVLVEDEVLNDVVVNKSALARIADHEAWAGDHLLATFKSDGLIVSTPTGSTAYSLSAGGPIVHPSVDCIIVTPICPHALTQKPIVLPGSQNVKVVLTGDVDDVFLTLDGKAGHRLRKGDQIEVSRSSNSVHLARSRSIDYFGVLRQKLRWGERSGGA